MYIRVLTLARAGRETGGAMGTDFLNIGPTPHDEECTQCNPEGRNQEDGIEECKVYIKQLIRVYGEPPKGCEFFIMENHHDAGVYHDVNLFYEEGLVDEETESFAYAMEVETGCEKWDEIAKQELINLEHHLHVAKVIQIKRTA